jgi:N-methylhydantoinase B/oxoprolinase/acetone carboxylase alpha subunit
MALFWGAPQKTKIDRSYQEPGDGMMARTPGGREYGDPKKRAPKA